MSLQAITKPASLNSRGVQHITAYLGLGIIVALTGHVFWMAGQNRSGYEASQAKLQAIQQQATLEDEAAKHRGLSVDIIQVPNYWYKRTPKVPPNNINIAGMKVTRIVKLIDAENECIGTIEDGVLKFRGHFIGVCNDKAIQKRYDNLEIGA